MRKQILALGATFAVLVAAVVSVLAIVDVITVRELRTTLGKSLSAIIVLTAGALAVAFVVKFVSSTSQDPH